MMKGGFGDMFKQAAQFQKKMDEAKRLLDEVEVTGRSGAGLVEVVMTCGHVVQEVRISDKLLADDKAIMEDLVVAAFNDAVKRVESETKSRLSDVASGMLPPGFKLPSL